MADRGEVIDAICEIGGRIIGRTHRLWRKLTAAHHGTSEHADISIVTNKAPRTHPPSLRPPTLMIDLLFGALMLFAFHMGDPNARSVVSRGINLPTSTDHARDKGELLLAAVPVKIGNTWKYELAGGERVEAGQALKFARKDQRRLVLVVAPDTPVQSYLDAEMPFRQLGVKVGLAIEKKGDLK